MKKRNNPKIDAMKQRSLIVESERQNLHTPKFYLTEQEEEIIRKGSYEYKKDESGYYSRRIGSNQSWRLLSDPDILDLVKAKVFGEDLDKGVIRPEGNIREFKKDESGYYYRIKDRGHSWEKASGETLDWIKANIFGEESTYSDDTTQRQTGSNLRYKEPNEMDQWEYIQYIRDNDVTHFDRTKEWDGPLDLADTKIQSLCDNLIVDGDLFLDNTEIQSLPNNLKVNGGISLNNTPIARKYSAGEIYKMVPGIEGAIWGKLIYKKKAEGFKYKTY